MNRTKTIGYDPTMTLKRIFELKGIEKKNEIKKLKSENKKLKDQLNKINTPEIHNFLLAVENEAKHQRLRWPSEHDAGKTNADWFWLIGYVSGKAIGSNDPDKILHHIITTAAVCLNWHAARMNLTNMRPGIENPVSGS